MAGVASTTTTLDADPLALELLVRNLIDNAIRYAPEGGRVEIAVERDGTVVRLVVDDSGPGIPTAERERVFDRFHRGLNAQSRGVTGSGLGLAIVRSVADAHGAHVALGDSPLGGLRAEVRFEAPRA